MATVLPSTFSVRLMPCESEQKIGFVPLVEATITGPVPSASECVIRFVAEDESAVHESRFPASAVGEGDYWTLRYMPEGLSGFTASGKYSFSVRIISELEGVDEVIYAGALGVRESPGGNFVLDEDSLLTTGYLWLDTQSDRDAPELNVSFWLKGTVDTYRLGVYLFYNGAKLKSSEESGNISVSHNRSLEATEPDFSYRLFTATLSSVRGYRIAQYANTDGWHELAQNPGEYDLKITVDQKLVANLPFVVESGLIAQSGALTESPSGNLVMETPVHSKQMDSGQNALGNDHSIVAPFSATFPHRKVFSIADVYRAYSAQLSDEDGVVSGSAVELTVDQQEKLDSLVAGIARSYRWYADRVEDDESSYVDQIPYGLIELDGFLAELAACADFVPADFPVVIAEESITFGDLTPLVQALKANGEQIVARQSVVDMAPLEPYLAVLDNDKARICADRPPREYVYYTSHKKLIETPEELRDASVWYFEGGSNEGGALLEFRTWSVRGFIFDEHGTLVDEYRNSGVGADAPSSAFP